MHPHTLGHKLSHVLWNKLFDKPCDAPTENNISNLNVLLVYLGLSREAIFSTLLC